MGIAALAPEYVRAIMPYQPGKPISELAREMGLNEKDIIKLASNENPLGMSPRARQAAASALEDINRYPDGNGFELKAALCQRYGVTMDQIVLGNGSNDVLEQAARVFLTPEAAAIYSKHAFAVYPLVTQAIGAKGIETPAKDWGHDLDAMLAAITPQVRMIFIANPNNPTGTLLGQAELERFLEAVPADVVVVLDEAYNEYLPPELRGDSIAWLRRFPNLIVSRTFSKAYGLASERVGWMTGAPALIDILNRLRGAFNVSASGQRAALAALGDQDFVAAARTHNARERARLSEAIAALGNHGISASPSEANFLLVHFKGEVSATAARDALAEAGYAVRHLPGQGLPDALRITIGTSEAMRAVIATLRRLCGEPA